jgi:modulator of FtsH protease
MQDWDTFALITGGAAGALIGLLFVAVSIRIDSISRSP